MDINKLKSWALEVSGAYLKNGVNMNDNILKISIANKLNEEEVKRVCELSNQNTYLSLFHSNKEGRGNINFDLAMSEKILKTIKELDMNSTDYLMPPTDFKNENEYGEPEEVVEDTVEELPREDIIDLAKKIKLADRLRALSSAINTMEFQENQDAEKNILKISSYCKGLVFNGESMGDMAKLALRFSKDKGFNLEKTAKLYTTISDYLSNKGFKVPMELTKVSSLKINDNHEAFEPLEGYHMNLIKSAALREMNDNIKNVCNYLKEDKKSMAGAVNV